jgi:hypothetical protein
MDALIKVLEHSAKYTGSALFTTAFILFYPSHLESIIPLQRFRERYAEELLILLIFLCFLSIAHVRSHICRYFIFPAKKLLVPKRGLKGRKQSRYLLEPVCMEGQESSGPTSYRGASSNGTRVEFFDVKGKRIVPPDNHTLLTGKYPPPKWSKIDWEDVFNGDLSSGTWALDS